LQRLAEGDRASMDLAAIDARLKDVDNQLGNLALSMGTANRAVIALLTNQMNGLTEQRASLERDREHVSRRAINTMRAREHIERLRAALGPELHEAMNRLTYDERRRTLMALGVRVIVGQRPEARKWGLPPFTIEASLPLDVATDKSDLWHFSAATFRLDLRWDFTGGRLAA
jgi:archaellum component FlaC